MSEPRHALVLLSLALSLALLSTPHHAAASDRLFAFTYETPALQRGQVEIEPWLTASVGRDAYYFRLDHRMELEWGLGANVQTAFYLNFRVQAEDLGGGVMKKETKFRGFSNEWKFSLLDPVADPLGLALYAEVGVQPHEIELEGKLLLDKAFGPVMVAVNVIGELEVKPQPEGAAPELEGKATFLLAGSVRLGKHVALGAELREMNTFEDGALQHAFLHMGPALHLRGDKVWFVLTAMPQLLDLASGTHNTKDGEWLETRIVFGIHL